MHHPPPITKQKFVTELELEKIALCPFHNQCPSLHLSNTITRILDWDFPILDVIPSYRYGDRLSDVKWCFRTTDVVWTLLEWIPRWWMCGNLISFFEMGYYYPVHRHWNFFTQDIFPVSFPRVWGQLCYALKFNSHGEMFRRQADYDGQRWLFGVTGIGWGRSVAFPDRGDTDSCKHLHLFPRHSLH